MGSRRMRVPTRALVRNEWGSGIARWGVWEPVRRSTVFLRSRRILTPTHPALRSLEALGAASGGGSRAPTILYTYPLSKGR